ncbi:hypothetical protein ABPG74_016139 [Tetrahymena malaccensis]
MKQQQNQTNRVEIQQTQLDNYVQKAQNTNAQNNKNTSRFDQQVYQENNNQQILLQQPQQQTDSPSNLASACCTDLCKLIIVAALSTDNEKFLIKINWLCIVKAFFSEQRYNMKQQQNQTNRVEIQQTQLDNYDQKSQNTNAQNNKNTSRFDQQVYQENNNQQILLQQPQQQTDSPSNLASACCTKQCKQIILLALTTSVFITFGVLFYIFQRDNEHNNYCENETFKKWAYSKRLQVYMSSDCGSLYYLAMIYCLILYITVMVFFIFLMIASQR